MYALVNPKLGFVSWDEQAEAVDWVRQPENATLFKSRKAAEDLRKLVGAAIAVVVEV